VVDDVDDEGLCDAVRVGAREAIGVLAESRRTKPGQRAVSNAFAIRRRGARVSFRARSRRPDKVERAAAALVVD